jgi:glutathione S-transferase
MFAAEKGIELDTVQIDLRSGEHFGEAFRAINPDCVVPALVLDDGTTISEVLAICDYLESLHPEPALFGRTPEERAIVLMWYTKIEQQGLLGVMDGFRNFSKGFKDRALPGPDNYAQIPELAERGRQRIERFLPKLNARLAGREFVAGDAFSIADITAFITVEFAGAVKVSIPDDAAELTRWYEAVASRPGARA